MKIVHLGPTAIPVLHAKGGAVQRRMIELAAQQAAAGHSVTVLSADGHDGEVDHRGASVVSVATRLDRPLRDVEFLAKARRHVRRLRPDIVHHHGLPEGARVVGYREAPALLSFDFFRFRGSDRRVGWRHYRRSLDRFDVLMPVSRACGELAAAYWPVPLADMRVLENGVSLSQFEPDTVAGKEARMRFGLGDEPIVLYVGRLCEQKGTDLLLEAWATVTKERPLAQLVLAGPVGQFGESGPNEFLTRIDAVGARYVGPVDEVLLNGVYNCADIFVMPTRRDEMFGMAALEAQACGKPVVASRWGGLTEAVGAESGVFFTPDSADELSAAMVELLDDPDRRDAMSSAALAHAAKFDWRAIAGRAMTIYEEARRAMR
ncbi:MAG: glycosyltransferase family 4 protein [Acidimicrobiia bacterium]